MHIIQRDCEHVFPFHNVSDDDNMFRNNVSVNCSNNMYIDSDSSLNKKIETFQYADYDYDKDSDPANNLSNRVLPSCKYYDNLQFNMLTKNSTNGLSIIHFNPLSLKANFHGIVHTLQTLNINFDIIAISETWTE